MKIFVKIISLAILLLLLFYLSLPGPDFPPPPSDSVQSMEKADTETPLRRAYFTNFTREQVIEHYQNNFQLPLIDRKLNLRLNYPPEDSQTLIRDQARSTYLEELVHPLRESLYINGFEPRVAKDDIWYKGQHFEAKIIIRSVPTALYIRLLVGIVTFIALILLLKEWHKSFKYGKN